MAGELASAIALQGQPRNRPQSEGPSEAMIDNAFNGRRRADEAAKAKKAADDEKRLNEILKNTAFTKQFDNPYYNRKYQNDAARAMDDIIRTYSEGGENSFVVARNKLRELESIMSTYELADKNMSDARKAASEKPDEYAALFNQQRIGSKTHATMFDALNDPELAGREDEIAEAFESPSAMFMKEQVNGNDVGVAMFRLQDARTTDPTKKANAALTDNSRFTRLGTEFEIKNRNTQLKVVPTHLDDEYLGQVAMDVYTDPSVGNNAVVKDFNQSKATALSIDPNKNFTWRDYMSLRGDLKNVVAKDADEFIANARKMTGQPYSVSDKLPSQTAKPTQSDFRKNFSIMGLTNQNYPLSGSKGKSLSVNEIDYVMGPNKTGAKRTIQVTGEHYVLSDGELEKSTVSQGYEVIPKGVAYIFKDNTLALSYNIPESTQVIYVPFNNKLAEQFMGSVGISRENPDDVEAFRENIQQVAGGQESAVKAITDFIKYFGPKKESGASGTPSSGQAPTGQQSPTSGVIGQTANKAASTGAKPQKIDVTKLTGMDRVRAINQNRANGYE